MCFPASWTKPSFRRFCSFAVLAARFGTGFAGACQANSLVREATKLISWQFGKRMQSCSPGCLELELEVSRSSESQEVDLQVQLSRRLTFVAS